MDILRWYWPAVKQDEIWPAGYNPIQELGLYYLQSRYYNPTWGRFINADALVSTGQGILGNNMFAYCRNSPVFRVDALGLKDYDCDDSDSFLDEDESWRWSGGGAASTSTNNKPGRNSITPGHDVGAKQNSKGMSDASKAADSSQNNNPLSSIVYTDKVLQDMSQTDFHGFPNIVDNYGYGRVPVQIVGGDRKVYYRLTIEGEYKGYYGDFVYIWDQNGMCNHRCFERR